MEDNSRLCDEARQCWYLTGATATGKTGVSLELARELNAEIVTLDSMTIYRGMDIGTAKASAADRAAVPHHLIDICDPSDEFTVSRYRALAHEAIRDIRSRGREVLFVGGSALYLKALLRGLFQGPPADPQFREAIEAEADRIGWEKLHGRLALVDPVTAHRLHVNDHRRIVRALEVFRLTGRPISHWQMEFETATPAEQCRVFALRRPRGELHQRIAARVRWMFSEGLVEEVRGLLARYGGLSHTASQAVGYQEVLAHLAGASDLAATEERVLVRTRRFARHQETWFRGLEECRIIEIAGEQPESSIAGLILAMANGRPSPPTGPLRSQGET